MSGATAGEKRRQSGSTEQGASSGEGSLWGLLFQAFDDSCLASLELRKTACIGFFRPCPNLWDVVAQAELGRWIDKQAGRDTGPGQAAMLGGTRQKIRLVSGWAAVPQS